MFPLVESLKLKDGKIRNLPWHQDRLNRALNERFPGTERIDLSEIIQIPEDCSSGLYKVRVIYGPTVEKIEIEPYTFRTIQSLKIVHHELVDYHLKYTDRQILQELFAQRGDCDDIIIIKDRYVSDSFAANILFFDGEKWFTPTTPLLKGTKRQFLLDQGIISEKEIHENDIRNYQKIGLVNALIDFDEMPVVPIEKIVY
jgi:4-amino-4-deoxychorismate lyase